MISSLSKRVVGIKRERKREKAKSIHQMTKKKFFCQNCVRTLEAAGKDQNNSHHSSYKIRQLKNVPKAKRNEREGDIAILL